VPDEMTAVQRSRKRFRRKPKAESATLKVSEQAAAIIAAKDAEITDLLERLGDDGETIAGLREGAERDGAEFASLRAALADRDRRIAAAVAALRPLAKRSGMTIAERAVAATKVMLMLEFPAEGVVRDLTEPEIDGFTSALAEGRDQVAVSREDLRAVLADVVPSADHAGAVARVTRALGDEIGDALARAALERVSPDPQSPESQASIDRMMVARKPWEQW
jgi:hypothetical protein